jgi:hypothetical protein
MPVDRMVIDAHDPERAADVLQELRLVMRKHNCVLMIHQGRMILAKIPKAPTTSDIVQHALMGGQPQAVAIAEVEQINPANVVWANLQVPITAEGRG